MPFTNYRGYPIPNATGDQPAGAAQIRALAAAVDSDVAALDKGGRLLTRLMVTASGTFVKANYPGLKAAYFELLAAGGGSGYCLATSATQFSMGNGGGGGMYASKFMLESAIASVINLTVGAGGVAGLAAGPSSGGTGGLTKIDDGSTIVQVEGGPGGGSVRQTSLGTGFRATGGTSYADDYFGSPDMVVPGDSSSRGIFTGAIELAPSYGGAGAVYGTKGPHDSSYTNGTSTTSLAMAGVGYGSGATGGFLLPSQSAINGAAGSAGLIVIWIYV